MSVFKLKLPCSIFWSLVALTVLLVTFTSGCSHEEAPPSHEEIVAAEFEAILDIHDQSCGSVASFKEVNDLVYKVACSSGEVYRITVSHEGQVNVAPHVP